MHGFSLVKIIEITGVPASGKSWYINEKLSADDANVFAFDAGVLRNKHGQLNQKWRAEITMWALLVFRKAIRYKEFVWILRQAFASKQPLRHRINLARNCLLKLAYKPYLANFPELKNSVVYIDEGLSHIPMVVQRTNEIATVVMQFEKLFGHRLADTEIVVVEHAGEDHVARLQNRGHTRIDTTNLAEVTQLESTSSETVQHLKGLKSPAWVMNTVVLP